MHAEVVVNIDNQKSPQCLSLLDRLPDVPRCQDSKINYKPTAMQALYKKMNLKKFTTSKKCSHNLPDDLGMNIVFVQ
jgi:hypothetical protein